MQQRIFHIPGTFQEIIENAFRVRSNNCRKSEIPCQRCAALLYNIVISLFVNIFVWLPLE